MDAKEKTFLQKVWTEWIFSQSTAVIICLIALFQSEYHNHRLENRLEIVEVRLHEQQKLQLNLVLEQLKENTKAMTDNTHALNDFRNFSNYQKKER
jgi:hypothetical protein